MSEPLLTPELQTRLAALELVVRRALPSRLRGDRRSPTRKGISLEFADYRGYVPGDDVRHLDWSSYARLDQLIVKLYHDEEDLHVHVLVDDSGSMAYGRPAKARFARQLAAAFAWIGLGHQSRVSVVRLADEVRVAPPLQGAASLARALEVLEEAEGEGDGKGKRKGRRPLHEVCRDYVAAHRPRGAVLLISDLLDPAGPRAVLRELARPVTDVSVVHVLARDEVEPGFEGDLRLVDMETGAPVEVSLSEAVLASYRRTARAFIAECAETCRSRGAAYARGLSDESLEDFLLRALVREGVLR